MSGGPRTFDWDEARRLRQEGMPILAVARRFGVSDAAIRYATRQEKTCEAFCPFCRKTRSIGDQQFARLGRVHSCRSCTRARLEVVLAPTRLWDPPDGELSQDAARESWTAWGWLAGIVDGEGCLSVRRNGRMPSIAVGMTDETAVRRCHAITDVGSVIIQKTSRQKPLYLWRVYGHDALDVAWLLLPLLITKKAAAVAMIETGSK